MEKRTVGSLDEFVNTLLDVKDGSGIAGGSTNGTPVAQSTTPSPQFPNINDLDDMSDEEKEEFYNSEDFKTYSVKDNGYSNDSVNRTGRNVQEIFGLGGNTSRYSHNCFEFFETDHEDYEDIVNASDVMQDTIAEGEKLLPTFKFLHEDIFMSLYQYDAQLLPPNELHVEAYTNWNILSKLLNTPTYIQLRKSCRCDMFSAGIGTEIIGKQAIEILKQQLAQIKDLDRKKKALDELVEQESEMDSISDSIDSIQEQMDELAMMGQEDSLEMDELQQQLDQQQLSLEEARERANQLAEQCDELVEQPNIDSLGMEGDGNMPGSNAGTLSNGSAINSFQMAQSINNATNEVETNMGYIKAWGLGVGNHTRVPFGSKKMVLEKIRSSPYLQDFTNMIGKYKECAIAEQKKKSKNGAVEINTVTTGNKIENVLPSDKMKLNDPVAENDFYRRWSQKQLLTYEKDSNKDKNKGPLILCLDVSGSMNGENIDWAKALSVGMLEIAQRQKRNFALIPYDHIVHNIIEIDKGEISPDKILEIAELDANGGTNFEAPLRKAEELIIDSKYKEADVVFITDGDCGISDSYARHFKQVKEDKEFRTFGVLISAGRGGSDETLKRFCDKITNIKDITKAKEADSNVNKELFGDI